MFDLRYQRGFAAISLVLIIVILLSAAGFIIWKQTHNTRQIQGTGIASSQATDNWPQGAYLEIRELGIKIKLSNDIRDATYIIEQNKATDAVLYAHISTNSIAQLAPSCNAGNSPLGTITKATGNLTELFGESAPTIDNRDAFQFGNTTFFLTDPQSSYTTDSHAQAVIKQAKDSFATAFRSLQVE